MADKESHRPVCVRPVNGRARGRYLDQHGTRGHVSLLQSSARVRLHAPTRPCWHGLRRCSRQCGLSRAIYIATQVRGRCGRQLLVGSVSRVAEGTVKSVCRLQFTAYIPMRHCVPIFRPKFCRFIFFLRTQPSVIDILWRDARGHPKRRIRRRPNTLLNPPERWQQLTPAGFDAGDHARGHANPLTFATAVVAEQMAASIKHDGGASLTPQRMLHFLQQALRRMNTVGDPNPYGRAATGVGQMQRQLNDMLLPDTTTTSNSPPPVGGAG